MNTTTRAAMPCKQSLVLLKRAILAALAGIASLYPAAAQEKERPYANEPVSKQTLRDTPPASMWMPLYIMPRRSAPGQAIVVTGADFGAAAEGRGLALQPVRSLQRTLRLPLTIERWTAKAIRANLPLKALPGSYELLLLDTRDRVLGRGKITLEEGGSFGRPREEKESLPRLDNNLKKKDERDSRNANRARRSGQEGVDRVGPESDNRYSAERPETGNANRVKPEKEPDLRSRETETGRFSQQEPAENPLPRLRETPRSRDFPVRPALALGGGGAKGAFQAGVLQNLYARGLDPVIITGTSVGALNAAKLAEGGDTSAALVALWRGITGNDSIFIKNPHLEALEAHKDWLAELSMIGWGNAEQVAKLPDVEKVIKEMFLDINALEGLHLQRPLMELVAANLDLDRVANSGIKLRLTTVERNSGELRYITEKGDIELPNGTVWQSGRTQGAVINRDEVLRAPTVGDGVLASSAIPLYFAPWLMKGGENYWDGATREGIPIHKALELGATDLIAILTGPRESISHQPPTAYTLTIERVRRVSKGDTPDDGSSGDYYARVKVGNRDWRKTGYYEDRNSVWPHWMFDDVKGDIWIQIKDNDSGTLGSDDDLCDASPASGRKRLEITLDPRRDPLNRDPNQDQIMGDVRGNIGDLIKVTGEGDSDRVEVWFRITPGGAGASGYLKDLPLEVRPLTQAMQLMMHQGSEVSKGDLHSLDMLDMLHEMAGVLSEGTVLQAVKSFPLPRNLSGRAYALPNYVLIEPPFNVGELTEFDPESISFQIELGNTVARWTKVDCLDRLPTRYDADGRTPIPTQRPEASDDSWLERQKRMALLGLIQSRIDTWRARERDGVTVASEYRARYERLMEKCRDLPILPPRRSHRAAMRNE